MVLECSILGVYSCCHMRSCCSERESEVWEQLREETELEQTAGRGCFSAERE